MATSEQVAKSLRDAVKSILGKKVKEPDLTIREAMNFAAAEPSAETADVPADLELVSEELESEEISGEPEDVPVEIEVATA